MRPSRSRVGRLAAALLAGVFASSAACRDPESPPAAPSLERDAAIFDRIVVAETVFPDPRVRASYDAQPPRVENGLRGYAFQLRTQPGMEEGRHFQIVGVTWAARVEPAGEAATGEVTGTGGPGGGFVEAAATTADRLYDVRVSLGTLLPNSVQVESIDVRATAQALARRYDEELARRSGS